MSILIVVKFEERSEDDDGDGESDKHLEARDRRYSCLKLYMKQVYHDTLYSIMQTSQYVQGSAP